MPQRYRVEIEREDGGRFLAEVVDLPGTAPSAIPAATWGALMPRSRSRVGPVHVLLRGAGRPG